MKPKKCATCKETFPPVRPLQKTCCPKCAIEYVNVKKEQAKRKTALKEYREGKERLKTKRDYIKEAQIAFNTYVRCRDKNRPCISCGAMPGDNKIGGGIDAGHYRSVGSAPHLRFNEANCHSQCKRCNRFGAGRAVDYRIGLIAKIGLEAVEALEADQTPRHHTIDELKAIKAHYKAKLKELKEKE